MTKHFPIALAAMLSIAACNKPADTTTTTVSTTDYSTTRTGGTVAGANSELPGDVQTAVGVSRALMTYPAMGDSIMTAFHLTANEFAALMKRIAADSTMSEEYRRATS